MKKNPDEVLRKLAAQMAGLPTLVGTEAVNFTLDNFRKQGFQGKTLDKWPQRKAREKGRKRNLLISTGRLRRSIRVTRTEPDAVWIGTDVPYARVHNEGGEIRRAARSETFTRKRVKSGKRRGRFARGTQSGRGQTYRAYSYRMPQRQFLGDSPVLRERIQKVAAAHIKKAFE